jgi:hypothetical protein
MPAAWIELILDELFELLGSKPLEEALSGVLLFKVLEFQSQRIL